ncbi:MAG: hypothetical protein ACK5O2_02930 [Microthrixaceae bacterium]
MSTPVVVARIPSLTQADLLAGHLRHQGIDAVVRTNLDRTTYAGLGGAALLVPGDQRLEAELELVLLESAVPEATGTDADSVSQHSGSRARWIRTVGLLLVGAMVIATVVPSLSIVWARLFY